MLFKATFCAECGEKIGAEAFRLTNRFLCERCAVGRGNQHLFLPIASVLILTLGGYFVGNISQTPQPPLAIVNSANNNSVQTVSNSNVPNQSQISVQTNQDTPKPKEKFPNIADVSANQANVSRQNKPPKEIAQIPFPQSVEVNEVSYYCGAKTQKGTPCMRKVKGGGRCWQHTGKPAMFPPEKLLIQP